VREEWVNDQAAAFDALYALRGEAQRLLAAAALPVHGHPGYRLRQPGRERRVPRGVPALLADLPDHAADHVVDLGRIESRQPLDGAADGVGVQIHRVDVRVRAARLALAHRRPDRLDDHHIPHRILLALSFCSLPSLHSDQNSARR
jgi:hypothetical protein